MAVVAQGVVELIPSAKGFSSKIQKEIGGDLSKAGDKQGRGLGGKVSKGFGLAAKAGFAGAGMLAGTALVKGFGRLKSIDDAEGKLKGLGHSSKTVDGIMKNALGSVKGTAFGLDEAATTAAGSVAAGIKPGKDLEGTLSLVADAATIGGTSMSEMGGIFNKVASSNKVQGDVINQLNERGIPIVQMLAKEMGVTEEEVYKLSQAGEIGFDDFRSAMESGLGGAAKEGGKTFSGAMANAGAALGRLGASFLSGVFPHMKTGLNELTGLFDRLGPTVEAWGAKLGAGVKVAAGGIGSFISDFRAGEGAAGRFRDVLSGMWAAVRDAGAAAFQALLPHLKTFAADMAALAPTVLAVGRALWDFLVAAFKAVLPYLKVAALVIGGALVGAMKILPPILSVVMSAIGGLLGFLRPLLPVVAAVGAALLTKFVVGMIAAGVQSAIAAAKAVLFNVQMAIFIARTYAAAAAQKIAAVATKAWAIAQRLMNAAMRANPIGLLITGLLLLGAGLVLAYKKSETFRRIVNAAWAGIKKAASATVGWFRNTAWPWMRAVFTNIANVAKWLYNKAIKPAFRGIAAVAKWLYTNGIKPYFARVRAAFRVVAAVAKWLWNKGIKPAFRGIVALAKWLWANGIKPAFNRIRGGIRAFAAAAKWLYNKGVRPAFRAITAVAKWLWNNGIKHYFGAIRGAIRVLAAAAKWLYNKGIKPAFNWIAKGAKSLWGKIKFWFAAWRLGMTRMADKAKWLYNKGIKPAFGWIADRAKWMWGKVKDIFAKLRGGINRVKSAFSTAGKGIRDAWSKLNGYVRAPIRKALKWMNDKFIGGLNKMLGTKILGISAKWRIPKIKGFSDGGWTGPGSKNAPAGVVHADEYVLQKKSRRVFERENPGALDHINRTGRLPGYRIGGKVKGLNKRFLEQLHKFNAAAGGRYSVYSGYRSNAHQKKLYERYKAGRGPVAAKPGSSQHNKGLAADLAPSNARNVHGRKFAKRFGLAYTVPSESWHIEPTWGRAKGAMSGLSSGGGLFDLPEWLQNPLSGVRGKVKNILKGFDGGKYGIAGKALPSVFKKLRGVATDKIQDAVSMFADDGPGMDIGGVVKGASVQRWAGTVKSALRVMGLSTGKNMVQMVLRRLKQESGGNPKAINNWDSNAKRGTPSKGLMQVIGPTFRAYRHPQFSSNIWNPMANVLASMRYARATYGSLSRAYNRRGGYAKGTDSATPGLKWVGEDGPELVRFAGGEQVFTRQQSLRMARSTPNVPAMAGAGLSGPVVVNVMDRDGTFVDRMRGEIEADHRQQAVRDRLRR